jgi:hypothetical protein
MRWRELTPVADRISARIQTHLASRSAFAVRFRRSDTVARFGSDRLQVVTDANKLRDASPASIHSLTKIAADGIPMPFAWQERVVSWLLNNIDVRSRNDSKLKDLDQSLWLDNITRDLVGSRTVKHYINELSVTYITTAIRVVRQEE